MKPRIPWVAMHAFVLSACGEVSEPHGGPDAPLHADAAQDAAPAPCDPTKPFGARVSLVGLDSSMLSISVAQLRFSADELTAYFHGQVTTTSDVNVYAATRASLADAFTTPTLMVGVNTSDAELDPSVTSNGLNLWFASTRVANEGPHIYLASRASTSDRFDNAAPVTAIAALDVQALDAQPVMTADEKELWFMSSRTPSTGGFDLWRAARTTTGFDPPVAVTELNSADSDFFPVPSADRLTIYFVSNRAAPGAKGGTEIWQAHRATVGEAFSTPTLVDELNTDGDDYVSWLSADNCRIYGHSADLLYVATRAP